MKKKHDVRNALQAVLFAMVLFFAACMSMGTVRALADGETETAALPGDAEDPENETEEEDTGIWPVEIDRTDCSISLTLQYRDANGNAFSMVGGKIALYKVAGVKEENGYVYDLSAGHFANVEGVDEIPSMKSKGLSDNNATLAMKLADAAKDMQPDAEAAIADGKVSFTNLTPGLYLLVQTEESEKNVRMNPFLMSIPNANGEYTIQASPKTGVVVPPETTPETTPETIPETTPPEPDIPKTGQNWWPVLILGILGFLLLMTGAIMLKKER
jgi:LPXTG-motif cell wall-anchored protein